VALGDHSKVFTTAMTLNIMEFDPDRRAQDFRENEGKCVVGPQGVHRHVGYNFIR
jgi:hypothetical protein